MTDTDHSGESQGPEQETVLYVTMDHFGGDWTPSAVLRSRREANRLEEMLAEDADAHVETASYYACIEDARQGETSLVPAVEEVTVAFTDSGDVLGVSKHDRVARELCVDGGLRTTCSVYGTAADVAADKPSVAGKFISAEKTAADLLGDLR